MINNKKELELRELAKQNIIETLENGFADYYCDLHNEIFNTNYFIIGRHKAEEFLQEYGVFAAIEKIQEYELSNFGETYTDLSNPERVANMLYYIIGEEELFELMDGIDEFNNNWNNQATEETNQAILKQIKAKGKDS